MAEPALVARGPAKRGDDFVEAARGLVVATMLAALAGMVDVIGYPHLKGLFVSFMSGNSTQLAAALGRGDLGVMLHNAVRIKAESDFALRLGLERGPDVHTAGIESGQERFLVPVLTYMTSDGIISATPDLNWPPAQSVVSVISTFDYEHGNGNMQGCRHLLRRISLSQLLHVRLVTQRQRPLCMKRILASQRLFSARSVAYRSRCAKK
jgi:hypothetical protein